MKTSGIKKFFLGFLAVIAIALSSISYADNPIIQTKFTADPAPMVYRDTVFLYTSHDEDDATGFKMFNWMLYTTTDMVNWTDHGIIAGVKEPYKHSNGLTVIVPGRPNVSPEMASFFYTAQPYTKTKWL